MKPSPRTLRLNIDELEAAFEMPSTGIDYGDDSCFSFLNLTNLDEGLIAAPPLQLWPEIGMRADVPHYVREVLVERLR